MPSVTRCRILRLKCIKFAFRWGSAVFKETPKGREGAGKEGKGTGRKGKGKGRQRRWREGLGPPKTFGAAPSESAGAEEAVEKL